MMDAGLGCRSENHLHLFCVPQPWLSPTLQAMHHRAGPDKVSYTIWAVG